jgi:hypothetical protein
MYLICYLSNLFHPVLSNLIRSDPIRSEPIWSDSITSDPIWSELMRSILSDPEPIRIPNRSDLIRKDLIWLYRSIWFDLSDRPFVRRSICFDSIRSSLFHVSIYMSLSIAVYLYLYILMILANLFLSKLFHLTYLIYPSHSLLYIYLVSYRVFHDFRA